MVLIFIEHLEGTLIQLYIIKKENRKEKIFGLGKGGCPLNVRCKSSETNVEIACDPTEHGRNSIVFLSDRAESLD